MSAGHRFHDIQRYRPDQFSLMVEMVIKRKRLELGSDYLVLVQGIGGAFSGKTSTVGKAYNNIVSGGKSQGSAAIQTLRERLSKRGVGGRESNARREPRAVTRPAQGDRVP